MVGDGTVVDFQLMEILGLGVLFVTTPSYSIFQQSISEFGTTVLERMVKKTAEIWNDHKKKVLRMSYIAVGENSPTVLTIVCENLDGVPQDVSNLGQPSINLQLRHLFSISPWLEPSRWSHSKCVHQAKQ